MICLASRETTMDVGNFRKEAIRRRRFIPVDAVRQTVPVAGAVAPRRMRATDGISRLQREFRPSSGMGMPVGAASPHSCWCITGNLSGRDRTIGRVGAQDDHLNSPICPLRFAPTSSNRGRAERQSNEQANPW
jgi:hypothetical protein